MTRKKERKKSVKTIKPDVLRNRRVINTDSTTEREEVTYGIDVQRQPLAHPDGALRMVAQVRLERRRGALALALLDGVGVDQHRERAAPDGEPRDEGAELRRREQVHLEHRHGVRPDRHVPEAVDPQLGDYKCEDMCKWW